MLGQKLGYDNHIHRHVCWYPPTNGYIEVNMDGSSLGNPDNIGYSSLCINHYGGWIQGFSSSHGRASNLFAEISGILRGLQLAWDLGSVESDSQAVLNLIANDH